MQQQVESRQEINAFVEERQTAGGAKGSLCSKGKGGRRPRLHGPVAKEATHGCMPEWGGWRGEILIKSC